MSGWTLDSQNPFPRPETILSTIQIGDCYFVQGNGFLMDNSFGWKHNGEESRLSGIWYGDALTSKHRYNLVHRGPIRSLLLDTHQANVNASMYLMLGTCTSV